MASFDLGKLSLSNRKRLNKSFRKEKKAGLLLKLLMYVLVIGALAIVFIPIDEIYMKLIAVFLLVLSLVISGIYNYYFRQWLLTKDDDFIYNKDNGKWR